MAKLVFDHALLPEGWGRDVSIETDAEGWITRVEADSRRDGAPSDADTYSVVAVPGLPNLHSHAFQRAMAGLAETRGDPQDSFWTWRQVMYRFVEAVTPEHLEAIAAALYVEMLEAGFTSVAEFHYLHHQPSGATYDDIGEMCGRIAAASEAAGIGLTLLPVFYAHGGFGGAPVSDAQMRFCNNTDRFNAVSARAREIVSGLPDACAGIAPHSLRAVTPDSLLAVLLAHTEGPVHIHIAEQIKEVEDCLAWSGARPVEWLLRDVDVNARWCLVHATHMTADETRDLAASNAVAGLCPITEANLGDGIFDGVDYLAAGGRFGVGSDSNVYVSAAEELRLLEYSQRLRDLGRNRLASDAASCGRTLFDGAVAGGAQALGRKIGRLAPGYRADIVGLDLDHASLAARSGDAWLDGWIFAGDNAVVREVWSAGRHMVSGGRHKHRDAVMNRYRETLAAVLES